MTAPTKRKTVAVSRRLPDAVEQRLQRDYNVRLRDSEGPLASADLLALCNGADALVCTLGDRIDADFIAALPDSIRIIATVSVGYDHVDIAAAKRRGIPVGNTPGVLTQATAEIAMLLMLGAARRASEGDRLVREGGWEGWSPTHMLGTQLSGRTLGIVGLGRIGQAVARMAAGFDITPIALGRPGGPAERNGVPLIADESEFLGRSQILSLHMPLTAETTNWLDRRRIELLPPGAIVVNTARGEVIDDDALVAALRSGRIAAAGLDVFRGEPHVDARFSALANTFLLPHLGSATVQTRNAMGFRALDNLDAYFAGAALPSPVWTEEPA